MNPDEESIDGGEVDGDAPPQAGESEPEDEVRRPAETGTPAVNEDVRKAVGREGDASGTVLTFLRLPPVPPVGCMTDPPVSL